MSEIKDASSRVQLVEKTLGIKLPEFKIHVSCREYDLKDSDVPDLSKWKHIKGAERLPPELEIHLPKEGMSPEQAIDHLNICSLISLGLASEAYQLYAKEVMMRFLYVAIKNCIYLASCDYENWNKPVKANEEDTFLDLVEKEVSRLGEAFRDQKPSVFKCQEKIGHLFLRLLLENNAPLEKGTCIRDDGGRCIHIFCNTIFELLMKGRDKAYSQAMIDDDWLYLGMYRIVSSKCYELTEQLQELEN